MRQRENETVFDSQCSDLNDQNLFHSTIDTAPGMPGVLKYEDNQTEVHSGELER